LKIPIIERKKSVTLSLKLISLSFFVVFIFSNSIIFGMHYINITHKSLDDDEIHVIGWVAENLPSNSKILVDRSNIIQFLNPITTNTPYSINEEVKMAIFSDYRYDITSEADVNCSIDYIEKSGDYERVIDLSDNNSIGSVSININLFSEIRSASIEFLIKTTDTSKGFWLNSSLSKVFNGFSLSVQIIFILD
jgi:hypothetical protein